MEKSHSSEGSIQICSPKGRSQICGSYSVPHTIGEVPYDTCATIIAGAMGKPQALPQYRI